MAHSRISSGPPRRDLRRARGGGAVDLAGAAAPGTESFEGVCEMSGTVRHQPPLTGVPAPTEVRGSFSGTCSGTFTDREGRTRQLDAAPADYVVRDAGGALSCLGGTATGTGSLLFGRGRRSSSPSPSAAPRPAWRSSRSRGPAAGSATVFGTVSPSEDLVELNERCNGSGVRALRGDARIVSPGISG